MDSSSPRSYRSVVTDVQQDKIKINVSGVSKTLLFSLRGRAKLSKEHSSLFHDVKAIELAEKIDFDFSTRDIPFEDMLFNIFLKGSLPVFGLFALRAKQFDDKVKAYVAEYPRASVVNIGAGLDTSFYRVDNGSIHWYDLDLPAVIDIRKQLIPETNRSTCIAKSLLDPSWCADIKRTDDGVFMIAGGVLSWLDESHVKQFFSLLADNFPGGEIVFNARPKSDDSYGAWRNRFPPEQRDVVRAARIEAIKDWWENAPQDQKGKLNTLITALKTPTKPRGTEWPDLTAWWKQLSTEEKEEAWRAFRAPSRRAGSKWTLADAHEMTRWDTRITVIDQFPLFKNISQDPSLTEDIRRFMEWSDEHSRSNIFHLRFQQP